VAETACSTSALDAVKVLSPVELAGPGFARHERPPSSPTSARLSPWPPSPCPIWP